MLSGERRPHFEGRLAEWNALSRLPTFAASVEAAMWIVALDAHLKLADTSYEARRDADPGGCVVRGLCWARNAGIHHLVNVQETESDSFSPMTSLLPVPLLATWKHRNELVTPIPRQPTNEAAYDKYVAGKRVVETLHSAQDFLWMRADPNPPTTEH
jgi:hypothetical protein